MAGTARVTQSAIELTTLPANNARVTQSVIELTTLPANNARVTQSVIEFLVGALLPQASCNNPPPGLIGGFYTHTLTATQGVPPYTWAITGGNLPPGLTLNASTGVISGAATATGTFNFTATVTDSAPRTGSVNCSITITAALAPITGGLPAGLGFSIGGCRRRNEFDYCMEEEKLKLQQITFPPLCSIPPEYRNWLPWDEDFGENAIPPGAVPMRKVGGILTPGPAAGDQIIITDRVPEGYDGLLAGMFHFYTGNGFIEGSGDILWRVQINQHYLQDLGNVQFTMGSPISPNPLTEGQILLSGQTIRYIVNVPNLSGMIQVGASQIVAGLIGFWWPR